MIEPIRLEERLLDAENRLRERSEFLDAVLDSIDTGVVACDARGVLTLFNRATREFHGLPLEPLPADRWPEFYSLREADGVTPLAVERVPLARALREGSVRNFEMVIAPANGRLRRVLSSGRSLVDRSGRVLGAVVAMQDITERKAAEDSLRRSEMFLESLVENLPDMLFVKDAKELRFVRFNRAGEELLGRSRVELLGRNDYDFFPPEQAKWFIERDRQVLAGRGVVDIPEERIDTTHGTRILHTKKIPVLDEAGEPRYLLGISQDITDVLQAEEHRLRLRIETEARQEAEVTNRRLREERELREKFVATLTHDLRGPLTAALTGAELIRRYPDKADARERIVNRVVDSIRRAESMIQDLLDAHLVQVGEPLPIRPFAADLARIIAESIEELAVVYGDRFDYRGPLEYLGTWDAASLRRLLDNLLGNAAKYSPPDARVGVEIETDSSTGGLRISVRNSGSQIPAEELPEIFEPYRRASAARAGQKKGWGLGLVLVRGIAEAHGGRVSVTSTAEEGTCFTVRLPVRVSS